MCIRDSSYTRGDVSGLASVGGLIGRSEETPNNMLTRSFSTGNITATVNVAGGLIGQTAEPLAAVFPISDSFSTSEVTGPSSIGALFGSAFTQPMISNLYWFNTTQTTAVECSGDSSVPGCMIAPDEAWFQGNSTNAPLNNWNFTTVWEAVPGDYPKLR